MTLSEMTRAMQNKDLSSFEIVSQYLCRIEQNKHLNAVIEINPDAITIAKRLDASNDKSGLLHGVPILLKR